MKNFVLLAWCFSTFFNSNAQEPGVLNKYKYVYIPQLYYDKSKPDIYGIRKTVADKLNSSFVPLIFEEDKIPMEVMKNPCLMIHCMVNNVPSKKGSEFSDIKILFIDCKSDTVLNCSVAANLRFNFNDTRQSFIQATQKAMEVFNDYRYQFVDPDSLSSTIPFSNDADSIQWSVDKKLSWNDFKGTADPHESADALTYTTHQSTFRAFGVGSRFHVESEVVCCFIKNKSWVKEGMKTDYLLNHEQRHFDLAEAGAREFRKKLKLTRFTPENFQKEVQNITREIDEKYKKLQQQYDKESDHSRKEEKQNEWNQKINSMLKELEPYKR
jgi:hypothetical protein